MRAWATGLFVLLASLAAHAGSAAALTLAPIGSFEEPTYITSEPSPERLLVTERLGKIELVDGSQTSTFADLTSLVGCPQSGGCAGERGLMSLAVAPDFAETGHIYVDYINNTSGQIHIDELTAEGDVAPLSSLRPVLAIDHSDAANHNGGQLQLGPEGDLYISTGDGGGGNDEFHNSQDLSSLLGKILRIDPRQSGAQPYTVPAGNPFPAATPPADTIWSYGLRNPFRFSFDRLSGDLVIADVGQGAREEVDFAPRAEGGGAGANWGWNCREGFIAGPGNDLPPGQCAVGSFAEPVFDYSHETVAAGTPCAIIGGYVVRDRSLGDLFGRYLYGDLCVGQLRSLVLPATGSGRASGDRSEGLTVENLNSFGEDSCRRIYAVSGSGEISRLEGSKRATCPPTEEEVLEEPLAKSPPPEPPLRATSVRLRAGRRRIGAGARVSLTASVSPCSGRGGQRAQLNQGGQQVATAPLGADCSVRFHMRLAHSSTFRVLVPAGATYLPARSPRLAIDVD